MRDRLYKYFTYKFHTDTLTLFQNLWTLTMILFNPLLAWHHQRSLSQTVLAIWKKINKNRRRVHNIKAKFKVGQHVRISKEKMNFAKGAEHNFSQEIFQIYKAIKMTPRPLYELEDLNKTPIEGQFYQEELTPVRIRKQTVYKIDKILDKRVRHGIREYLVRWQGYNKDFDTWIPASSVRNI